MQNKFQQIANKEILLKNITNQELVDFCIYANDLYRAGTQIISDNDYDFVFLNELKNRIPDHPFLQKVENETAFGVAKLQLPQPMLSTDKAFTVDEVQKWIARIIKTLPTTNIKEQAIKIKITPKLDGFAAFDDGKILYTRGDGKKGSDISRVFERGMQVFENNKRGLGAGEIVVKKSYFDKFLSNDFEHSRNFQASIIREKPLDRLAKNALQSGAAVFTPFSTLPFSIYNITELFNDFAEIIHKNLINVDFDVDGVIFEVINPAIKIAMGSNRKFHRWMIAFKENKEVAQVEVEAIIPQVGRTGKITPVAKLKPTKLSGATISHASCYHYRFIQEQSLGAGSVVELIRSGLVIPKIVKVLHKTTAKIPTNCPSCNSILKWQSDFLVCTNHQDCSEQIIEKNKYFFKTLANNDGLGGATIKIFFENNIKKLSQIYKLSTADFMNCGFGEKTSTNLFNNLQKSRSTQIEDYRFLASFGIERLGLGNSENLLKKYNISEIFNLHEEQIANIDGFAAITAKAIIVGLKDISAEFSKIYKLNFNLEKTVIKTITDTIPTGYFADKKLVFTGAMQNLRDEMQKQAKNLGAIVQKAVSGKTDFLIIGEKVGPSKLAKAELLGITIISEQEYLSLVAESN